MLVHPKDQPHPINEELDGTVLRDLEKITYCFAPRRVEECQARLRETGGEWAENVLKNMEKIRTPLLQDWFDLLAFASTHTLDEVYQREIELAKQS